VGRRRVALVSTCPLGEKAVEKTKRLEKISGEPRNQNEVTRTFVESIWEDKPYTA
jgi:hypothetical protein